MKISPEINHLTNNRSNTYINNRIDEMPDTGVLNTQDLVEKSVLREEPLMTLRESMAFKAGAKHVLGKATARGAIEGMKTGGRGLKKLFLSPDTPGGLARMILGTTIVLGAASSGCLLPLLACTGLMAGGLSLITTPATIFLSRNMANKEYNEEWSKVFKENSETDSLKMFADKYPEVYARTFERK